jgi:hypothetical protein
MDGGDGQPSRQRGTHFAPASSRRVAVVVLKVRAGAGWRVGRGAEGKYRGVGHNGCELARDEGGGAEPPARTFSGNRGGGGGGTGRPTGSRIGRRQPGWVSERLWSNGA